MRNNIMKYPKVQPHLCACGCGALTKYKYARGHNAKDGPPLVERFWKKVDIRGPDECWPWLAGKASGGYGCFCVNGHGHAAHRFAYEFSNGPIPDDLCVLHRCDNPPCCNPNHLFLGTIADNNRDRKLKGRTYRPIGIKHHNAKLTDTQVIEIRRLYSCGNVSHNQLANKFGVRNATIGDIILHKTWTHIP